MTTLREAAQAVVDRWDTPLWKNVPATALYIAALREALAHGKEWQGLTDDEIKKIVGPWGDAPIKGYTRKLFDLIESKLKEKNT